MLFFFVFYTVEAQEVTDTVKGYNTGKFRASRSEQYS